VSICTIPNSASSRQRIVKVHTHARFLRALTHEDIDSGRLLDLSGASEKFVTIRVGGFDADNNITITLKRAKENISLAQAKNAVPGPNCMLKSLWG